MKKYFQHKLKNLINIEKIVTIHHFEFPKNFRSQGESHDFWEMVYAEKEDVLCTSGEEKITLAGGEALFHKPNEFHALSANGIKAPDVVILSFVCKSDAMLFFENKKMKIDVRLRRILYLILEEGKRTFDIAFSDPALKKMELLPHPTLGGEQLIKNYLEILLIDLLRSSTETAEGNDVFLSSNEIESKPVNEIVEILRANLYESLTVADISEKTYYGKSYLFRVFKAKTGKTIMRYYTELKLEEAKRLLRENELTVRQISDRLAFGEPNYFCKTFRRFTGMTPTEYKKRAMSL